MIEWLMRLNAVEESAKITYTCPAESFEEVIVKYSQN